MTKHLAWLLSESGALMFGDNLKLKDGRSTSYFINLGKCNTALYFQYLIDCYRSTYLELPFYKEINILVGASYKGSSIASALCLTESNNKQLKFDYDRSQSKTHGEGSEKPVNFVMNAIDSQSKILIVDDVVTSMGTKKVLIDKIKQENSEAEIKGILVAIDRSQGESKRFFEQTGIPTYAIADIVDVVLYIQKNNLTVDTYKNGVMTKELLNESQLQNILETPNVT